MHDQRSRLETDLDIIATGFDVQCWLAGNSLDPLL